MFKSAIVLCLACFVVNEARPKWQFLPSVPGYVPVYIQTGDTPLDQIHPELAEAFHVLPAGRSASKQIEASSDEQPEPVLVEPAEPMVAEEPEAEAKEPAVKAQEPVVKVQKPAVKAEEPVVKADKPVVKAEEPEEALAGPEEDSAMVETTELKEAPEEFVDHRPYAKKVLEKKKKVTSEVAKPERR